MEVNKLNLLKCYEKDLKYIFKQIGGANNETYSDEYISNQIEKMKVNIENKTCFVFAEIYDNELVGFIWAYYYNGNNIHISFLGVKQEYRKMGIGRKLLWECKTKFPDVNRYELYVDEKNNAFNFYKANGFIIFQNNNGNLFMVNNNIDTPYFEIDEEELLYNIDSFKNALSNAFDKFILGYSFKTNSLAYICNLMKENECFAEVVSYDEYELALALNFDRNKIIYNGPMKNKKTFLEAIENDAIVNIETEKEIQWLEELSDDKKYKIGIRINFDIEELCPNESACGDEGGRFGFCIHNNSFDEAYRKITSLNHISVSGIHLHTSSKTRSLKIYQAIARTAVDIINKYHMKLDYIDVGGGFFGGMPEMPSFNEYMSVIKSELSQLNNYREITVIVEPGAALIASPISFVTSVIDVKETNRNIFVVTDGSRNDIDPLMKKNKYLYEISSNCRNLPVKSQVISGFTCMEDDRLFKLENHCKLELGDRIRYKKVGSYTMCLSPLFIKYFPDVYVKKVNDRYLVREKWSTTQYLQNNKEI